CGIGRFAAALHGRIGRYKGIDVSDGMIAAARRRCAVLDATAFAVTAGRELAGIADRSFDLILAIDSLPYLRRIGLGPFARHFGEAARVLRPGGDLVVFNYSYRGDLAADRSEVAALAEEAGLHLLRNGEYALATWDGAGFHLRRSRV